METKEELVAFVKELLQQRPSRQMLKIYTIGSTLALLGAIAGLLQSVLCFEEEEERPLELERMRERDMRLEAARTEEKALDQSTVLEETTEEELWAERRRSSAHRLHAS